MILDALEEWRVALFEVDVAAEELEHAKAVAELRASEFMASRKRRDEALAALESTIRKGDDHGT